MSDHLTLTTTETNGHTHTVNLDALGNGTTSEEDGHTHVVLAWVVQEADGHTHEINVAQGAQGGEFEAAVHLDDEDEEDDDKKKRGRPLRRNYLANAVDQLPRV